MNLLRNIKHNGYDKDVILSRRVFWNLGIAIGGLSLSAKSYNSVIGANDRINLALIGIRNQGSVHIGNWSSIKDSHSNT